MSMRTEDLSVGTEDWVLIAEQLSVEMDPVKLMILTEQLCNALDCRKKSIFPVVSVAQKADYAEGATAPTTAGALPPANE